MEDGPCQLEYRAHTQGKGKKKKKMVPVGFSKAEGKHQDGIQQLLSLEGVLAGSCHLRPTL